MKINPKSGLWLVCMLCGFFASKAQNDADVITPTFPYTIFMNPEPKDFDPVSISVQEAAAESEAIKGVVGFDRVYFTKESIANILSVEGCVGIRFYNGLSTDGSKVTVLAIGIKSDGMELPNKNSRFTISNGLGVSPEISELRRGGAQKSVVDLQAGATYKSYTTFFSKNDLEEMVFRVNASGIFIRSAHRRFKDYSGNTLHLNTMSISPAELSGGALTEWGGESASYQKSLHPCPYVCGEMGNYLSPIN